MEYQGLTLDRFQEEAINHVDANRSVLVSAPTGTGKTLIADYIVEKALSENKEVIYTAPIKALSNQKYRDYTRLYGYDKVGLVTGDNVINRDGQLRIMTTEILRNMLLAGEELPHLSHVIIDEIHFLDDIERGTVWEEVLIYLPSRVKILGLSATLANIHEFSEWLAYVRDEEVPVVIEDTRHVPLSIYLANRDAGICDATRYGYLHERWMQLAKKAADEEKKRKDQERRSEGRRRRRGGRKGGGNLRLPGQRETKHVDLIRMLGVEFQPILFFAFSRKMCEQFSRELARKLPDEGFTTEEEKVKIKAAVDSFDLQFEKVMTTEQEKMYLKGIACHHAGLHVGLKAFVEELYEQRLIKVNYCTSTFALGINLPARTTCFQALRKYNGRTVVPLTVRQFMQKAGRAGRRGIDDVGYVVILEEFWDYERDREAIDAYIKGAHEKVRSAFNLSFNSVVNLLDRHGRDLEQIRQIIDKSFLTFSYRQAAQREEERIDSIADALAKSGWDPRDEAAGPPPRSLMARAKKYRKLSRRTKKVGDKVWDDFMEKVGILQEVGYLEEDLEFNAGAKVLRHLQIEEIFSTELVLSGLLDSMEPEMVFGAVCVLCNSFSRAVNIRVRPKGEQGALAKELRKIRFGEAVRNTEYAIGQQTTFTPEMIAFGTAWYRGESLQTMLLGIESATDISGDLVSAFRRAKDLCQQLKRVYEEDPYMSEKLREILKTVSRDEVEVVD
ncbi:MAG: DEAD/DEAH box helicase [Deltaproteobacteria bacterium]|nr:DEAD/DEAH box helicase [Deltaproteobacteria bacterium]